MTAPRWWELPVRRPQNRVFERQMASEHRAREAQKDDMTTKQDDATSPDAQLFAALARAQAAVGAARKDKINPQLRGSASGGKYTSAEGMIQTAKPVLADEGLAIVLVNSHLKTNDNGPPILDMTHAVIHIGGGRLDLRSDMAVIERKGTPLDKATAIARTFGLTYAIRDALMIPRVGEGEEANQRNDEHHAPRQRQPAPPQRGQLPGDLGARIDACVKEMGRDEVGKALGLSYDDLVMRRRPEQEQRIQALEAECARQREMGRASR